VVPVPEKPVAAEADSADAPRPSDAEAASDQAAVARPAPAPGPPKAAPAVEPLPDLEPEPEVDTDSDAPEPALEAEPEADEEPEAPPAAVEVADPSSRPDPSDYSVHGNRVTVQAAETLGHYAEWLEVRASQLRRLNRMRFEQPVVIGQRLKLDFARVSPAEFEQRRLEYHQSLQNEYFEAFVVTGTERHVLAPGESLWYLAKRKYRVPVWLLRQYNPDLDFAALPAGSPLVVPVVEPRTS